MLQKIEELERKLIEKDILRMFYANFGIPKDKRLDNEVYYPIYKSKKRYNLIYGGRGSGKSFEIEGKLPLVLIGCLPFCRVMMIRQVYNSIKGSQFQEVCDYIDKWDLYKYFDIFKSPMKIVHKASQNYITFAGMDKPQSLKSIKDITHVIFGEAFQISNEEGVSVVDKSVRTPELKLDNHKLYFVFNPDNKNHWLHEHFFDTSPESVERFDYKRKNSYILKTTYRNNKFINEAFIQLIEADKKANKNRWLVDSLGEWGDIQTTGLYYPNFNYDEVVEDNLHERVYDPLKPLFLTWDFNVYPYISLELSQVNYNPAAHELELCIIDEICLTDEQTIGRIDKTCEALLKKYHKHIGDVVLFGDKSGHNRKTTGLSDYATIRMCLSKVSQAHYQERIDEHGKTIKYNPYSYYERYGSTFKLKDRTIKSQNPLHTARKVFFERLHSGVLSVLPVSRNIGTKNAAGKSRSLSESFGNVRIVMKIDSKCRYLIRDYQEVKTDEKTGGKSTRDKTLTHTSDAVDYLATEVFDFEYKLIVKELQK